MSKPAHAKPTLTARRPTGRAKLAGGSLSPAVLKGMAHGDELADPERPGLRVRRVHDRRVFGYRYRNPVGALRQVEVGVLGPKTLAQLHVEWERLRDVVRGGGDPRAQKKADKETKVREAKAAVARVLTVGDIVDQYLQEGVEKSRKAKGAAETRRLLEQLIRFGTWTAAQRERDKTAGRRRKALPKGVRDVADVSALEFTRQQAHELLVAFGESAPRAAAMARQELRGAWRYAIAAGRLIGPSPFEKVPGAKLDEFGGRGLVNSSKRERALSAEEAGALLRWMAEPGTYSRTVRDALELVVRTGLRSGEVCAIHSRELVRRDGVLWLDIPAARMKAGAAHSVPLVGRAEQIVLARVPEKGGYLFAATSGDKAIEQKVLGVEVYACSGRSTAKAYAARKVCPVGDWTVHDLRRTARSLLAALGCPYEVGEAVLAHTLPGVHGVYNRHDYAAAKVEWLAKLGQHLDKLAAAKASLRAA